MIGMHTGTVVFFSAEKGYGFIRRDEDGIEFFCHFSQLDMPGYKKLYKGDEVEFEIGTSPQNGKPQAENVRVIRKAEVA